MTSRIAVIVPVRAGDAGVCACLQALHEQTLDSSLFSVTVVENGGATASLSSLLPPDRPQWQHVFLTEAGSYAARNAGVSATTEELLAFTDADCIPDSRWLEAAVQRLDAAPMEVIGGRIVTQTGDAFNAVEQYDALTALDQEHIVKQRRYAVTANVVMARATFERAGPFAPVLSGGDYEWGNRAVAKGIPLSYAPEMTIRHTARHTLAGLYERNTRIARGLMHMKHPAVRSSKCGWLGKHASMLLGQSLKILRAKHLTVWQKLQVLTVWKFAVFASAMGTLGKRG